MVKSGEISEDVSIFDKYGWIGSLVDVVKNFFSSGGTKLQSVIDFIKNLWGKKEPEINIERSMPPSEQSLKVPYTPSTKIYVEPFTVEQQKRYYRGGEEARQRLGYTHTGQKLGVFRNMLSKFKFPVLNVIPNTEQTTF